eukprot:TRINITY_DN3084_c1_g1_i2.p2 TRINITY_DN3084_c1_g1~~TRINITY_DN3084_c1_g1_i2.p2  ORF type:complete len:95 (-),score=18.04 TRINITY_DN3084_c1_g1_i2:218-502(-)
MFAYVGFEDFEREGAGVIERGDPFVCFPGEIANEITKNYKIVDISAGFTETALITECGKVLLIGSKEHILERPYPMCKLIDLEDYVHPGQKSQR